MLCIKDWNLFWTAFGAIGGTIGAFATAAAVFVALWQTKYSNKKKLKLSFSNNIAVVPEGGGEIFRYIGVTVTNIGNRDVIISNWGFKLDDGSKMLIITDSSPIGRALQVKLPHKLQIEENITLYYKRNLFETVLKENINNHKLQEDKKIQFFVVDSTSKKHCIYTDLTAKNLLLDIQKENNKNKKNDGEII